MCAGGVRMCESCIWGFTTTPLQRVLLIYGGRVIRAATIFTAYRSTGANAPAPGEPGVWRLRSVSVYRPRHFPNLVGKKRTFRGRSEGPLEEGGKGYKSGNKVREEERMREGVGSWRKKVMRGKSESWCVVLRSMRRLRCRRLVMCIVVKVV